MAKFGAPPFPFLSPFREYDEITPPGRPVMKRLMLLVLIMILAIPAIAGAQGTEEKRYQIPLENSPSIGPADAPVVMFEFLDFQ